MKPPRSGARLIIVCGLPDSGKTTHARPANPAGLDAGARDGEDANLDIAEDELKRISHITRQTLGFYRESSVPANVSVNSIMDSTVDLLRRKIVSKGACIEKQYDGDLQVVALAGELRQVFSNLLTNSLEAIEERGAIKLRVCNSR